MEKSFGEDFVVRYVPHRDTKIKMTLCNSDTHQVVQVTGSHNDFRRIISQVGNFYKVEISDENQKCLENALELDNLENEWMVPVSQLDQVFDICLEDDNDKDLYFQDDLD